MKKNGYNIEIINLVYYDLERTMRVRLSNSDRNHSDEDIEKRIDCAKRYEEQFRKKIDNSDILKIYTDLCDAEEAYNIVKRKKLKWGNNNGILEFIWL